MDRRVWIGLEGSYAAGRLVGRWVDASDCTEDGIADVLDALQTEDPEGGDELSIMDSEGWSIRPESYRLTELSELSELLDERPETAALWEAHGHSYYATVDALRAGLGSVLIDGPIDDLAEWAEDYARDAGLLQDLGPLANHIDWSGYAEDLTANATEVTVDGSLYLVWS